MTCQANPLKLAPVSHMDTVFSPGCSTFDSPSCLYPGKNCKGWPRSQAPACMWEPQRKLLAFSFMAAQSWSLQLFGSKPVGGKSPCCFLCFSRCSPVTLTFK